jgi:hypothetical protein
MAELIPKLTLTGTAAHFGAALSLAVEDSLTVGAPTIGLSKKVIGGGTSFNVYTDSGTDGSAYVYIKNANTSDAFTAELKNDADNAFGTLHNGEFAFYPIDINQGLTVTASGGDVTLEYAYWTKA